MTSRALALTGYAVLGLVAVALEVRARRSGRATFGDAVTATLRAWPVRLLVLAAWLWLGWHVFVRVDWQ